MKRFIPKTESAIVALYLMLVLAVFFINLPMPQDDLLRDIVAGDYGYNYWNLYAFSPLMAHYNQYIVFDIILHHLAKITNREFTAHAVQLFCLVTYTIPCLMIFNQRLKFYEGKYWLMALLLIYTYNDFAFIRIILARPEMLFTNWILFGLALKHSRTSVKVCWIVVGFLLIPCYWLSVFYVPAIYVVLNNKVRKIGLSLIFMIVAVFFWQWYSDNTWLESVRNIGEQYQNRLATVGENKSVLIMLLSPITSFAIIFYLYLNKSFLQQLFFSNQTLKEKTFIAYYKIKSIISSENEVNAVIILLTYFVLFNQIRYGAIITALFAILLVDKLKSIKLDFSNQLTKFAVLCLVIFVPFSVKGYINIPRFTMPEGALVLASSQSNYFVPFTSTGRIFVTPSMEIGATDRDIQQMLKTIDTEGTINCKTLQKYKIQFVVERNLTMVPSCLKIYQVQKGWRAWKFTK